MYKDNKELFMKDLQTHDAISIFKSGAPYTFHFVKSDGSFTENGQRLFDWCTLTGLSVAAHLNYVYLLSNGGFEISFKGLLRMMAVKCAYKNIHADVVLAGDVFKHGVKNYRPYIEHERVGISGDHVKISPDGKKTLSGFNIKDLYGAYAMAYTKDDHSDFICCTVNSAEIDASIPNSARNRFSVWYKYPGEMAKKIALKRLAKIALLSAEDNVAYDIAQTIEIDNEVYNQK